MAPTWRCLILVVLETQAFQLMMTATKRTGLSYLPRETVKRIEGTKNKFEKAKFQKDPTSAWTDIYDYAAKIRAGELAWEDIDSGDTDIRFKWCGMLSRFKKTPGKYMLRLRTPNGLTTPDAMRLYADALEDCGGVADITTRQNWQLRNLTLEQGAALIERLDSVNVTSYQSALDNVRNVVGSPFAGLDPDELVDTRPYCIALNDLITIDPVTKTRGNPVWGNLPRKFNIAISSNAQDYAHCTINDLAFEAVKHSKTGEVGFNVVVGGYFSSRRSVQAVNLNLWIPATVKNVLDVSTAVLTVFRDEGPRVDRQKARLMWLVESYGVDAFKNRILQEPLLKDNSSFDVAQTNDVIPPRLSTTGVHTTESGVKRVGLHVPVGRLSPSELRSLADLVDKHTSSKELRLTVEQNLMFPDVADPDALLADVKKKVPRLSATPGVVSGNTVSCTGAQYCPVAIIETKALAERISLKLDKKLNKPVRLHVTGCPNSCGQVQMADIGLMGAPARRVNPETGKAMAVPGCDVYVGGTIGHAADLSLTPVLKGVPIDNDDDLIKTLLTVIRDHLPHLRPTPWWRRILDLRSLLRKKPLLSAS